MATSIGALSAPTLPSLAPSPIGEALQGLDPSAIQDAQVKSATAQSQMQTLGSQQLARLAQAANATPDMQTDPRWIRQVEQVYRTMGMPVPMHESGGIDINAMLPPMPPDMRQKILGLPQASRAAMSYGYQTDPTLLTAPVSVVDNPAMVNNAHTNIQKAIHDLGTGNGTISDYILSVKSNAAALGGMDSPEVQSLLDPTAMQGTLGATADAHISEMQQLGIASAANAKYRSGYLDYLNKSLTQRTSYQNAQLDLATQRIAQRATALDQAASRLSGYLQDVGNNTTKANLAVWTAQTGPILKLYQDTQNDFNGVLKTMSTYTTNGQPVPEQLTHQMLTLQNSLANMKTLVEQARTHLANVPGNNAATTLGGTGQNVVRDHNTGAHGSIISSGTDRSGKAVHKYADGAILYEDGSPYKP